MRQQRSIVKAAVTVFVHSMVLFCARGSLSGMTNDVISVVKSPSGRYSCQATIVADNTGERIQGERVFLFANKQPEKRELVFESVRTVDVLWSPDDRYFAILDHNDGHTTALFVFFIREQPSRQGVFHEPTANWRIERVYSSPMTFRGETFWSVKAWDLRRGTVTVECEYLADEDWLERPIRFTRRAYVIPIDYK